MLTTDGTHVNEDKATVTTAELGTVAIAEDGSELGTLVHEMIAIDGDDATTTTDEAGHDDTEENGTATGDEIVDGMVTVAGT
jgi:hypothetical protein